jgi:hypothetical protein
MSKDPPQPKKKNEIYNRARELIEAQMKKMDDDRRRLLMKKRVEFVTHGVESLEQHKYAEAVASFRNYIHLLEDWKKAGDGELMPSHFDAVKDGADVLLLTAVSWELTKIFDRMDSDMGRKDFRKYLGKVVVFSKGTSYQGLCAEAIRRYRAGRTAVNKGDLKQAHEALGGKDCFVATSLMDVSAPGTLVRLRAFRDERLAHSRAGRGFIRAYYVVGPYLAQMMNHMPQPVRKLAGAGLGRLAELLGK